MPGSCTSTAPAFAAANSTTIVSTSSQLRFRNFPEVGAVLIITVAVVVFIDTVSSSVRKRIIAGGSGDPSRMMALIRDLGGSGLARQP
jgi:hypothetical protein